MANKTIAELTAATLPLDLTELLHVDQGTNSRKVTVGGLLGEIKWLSRAIGEPFAIWDHLTGADVPPIDSPNCRFILLTAGEDGAGEYNEGVLTSESVTGSAPLVQATAVIDDASSPMDGQTVRLINTERRFLRAGSAGTVEADQFQGHRFGADAANPMVLSSLSQPGVNAGIRYATGETPAVIVSDGTNGTPRFGDETRGKNMGATYYMRIR
ncbi:hypothetical protein [Devosia indica]